MPLGEKQTHLDRIVAALLIIGILVSIASVTLAVIFYTRYLGICCTKMSTTDATLFNVLLGLTWMTTFIWGTAVIVFWTMMPHRIAVAKDAEVSVTQKPGRGFFLAIGSMATSFWSIPFAVSLELVLQKIDFY
uniref:G_PROTEIN_RECEP_F2_4 domain-containing protein n=1 Tax=Panagrellus redivivus TaxID=6233 RepID=A0A7E4ZVX7_PANRE